MSGWGIKDDKSSTGTVTLTAPTITFNGATAHAAGVITSAAHPFQTGDIVVYSNGGGTSIVGLTSGSTYFIINLSANTVGLAETEGDALKGAYITTLTDGVGASHTLIHSLNFGRGVITGSSTLFTTEAASGDFLRVGSQEMIILTIASNTSCQVLNANPETAVLSAFSGQQYTLNEKPTSLASDPSITSINTFGVDTNEIQAAAATKGIAHAGWVARTTRGSRTTFETLVALSKNGAAPANMSDFEDTVFPDAVITIVTQPTTTVSAVAGDAIAILGAVTATVVPSTASITYLWQQSVNGGVSYSNINPAGGVFTGATSATLGVNVGMTDTSSTWNAAKFRCILSVTGGASVTSGAVTLTVTAP
jgi:hypothetical protein